MFPTSWRCHVGLRDSFLTRDPQSSSFLSSAIATGGVYKEQGLIQCGLMTHVY